MKLKHKIIKRNKNDREIKRKRREKKNITENRISDDNEHDKVRQINDEKKEIVWRMKNGKDLFKQQ